MLISSPRMRARAPASQRITGSFQISGSCRGGDRHRGCPGAGTRRRDQPDRGGAPVAALLANPDSRPLLAPAPGGPLHPPMREPDIKTLRTRLVIVCHRWRCLTPMAHRGATAQRASVTGVVPALSAPLKFLPPCSYGGSPQPSCLPSQRCRAFLGSPRPCALLPRLVPFACAFPRPFSRSPCGSAAD